MAQIKVNIELTPEEYDRFLMFKELITAKSLLSNYKYQLSDNAKALTCEKYESVLAMLFKEYSKYKKCSNYSSITKTKEYNFETKESQYIIGVVDKERSENNE